MEVELGLFMKHLLYKISRATGMKFEGPMARLGKRANIGKQRK